MKGFYMLGSDYPVQLWMRPIARPKAREGSWETSHDIGQLLRAPLTVCHGDSSVALRLLHAADAAWQSSPVAPSAKELQRGESSFP